MKIPNEGLLRLDARSEFDCLSYENEVLCMTATITAPKLEQDIRAPLNIVCVIDHSASMARRMKLMKQTLSFMVTNLRCADTLTLITFDKNVHTLLQRTNMDAEGALLAQEMIRQCKIGNGTNLSGGLFEGFESLKSYTGDAVNSLMIFTDGVPTAGIRAPQVMLERTRKYISEIQKTFSVFTFGYGTSHDAELLRKIAESANGMYNFINSPDAIPTSFGACMGGLLSCVATDIHLNLVSIEDAMIVKVYSSFKKDDDGRFFMGDLYSEERRDIVFEVLVHHYDGVQDYLQSLVHIDVTYINPITQKEEKLYTDGKVYRTSKNIERQTNLEVDMQRNRAKMVIALKHSLLLAQFQLPQAKQHLQKTMTEIANTPSANAPFVQALLETLQSAVNGLVDTTTYQSVGSKTLNSAYMESDRQRSNGNDSLSVHFTTSFKQMCSEYFSGEYAPIK